MASSFASSDSSTALLEDGPENLSEIQREEDAQPVELSMGRKVLTIVVVGAPVICLAAAMILMWGRGFHWIYLALFFGMYLASGLGITVGYHRLFTHKSFDAPDWVRWIWAVLGSMAVEGPVIEWVGMHRCHHQHSDEHGDPHSPNLHGDGIKGTLLGFWHAHTGWMFRPNPGNLARYVVDFKDDRVVQSVSRQFFLWMIVGLLIPAVIAGLVTQSWLGALLGFFWGGAIRMMFVHHVTWSINSVCHIWGARPYKSHDESRNNVIMGVLGLGEGWHNNHHAFPASARHGLAWWQFDISYIVIRGMEMLGLARRVRVPDAVRMASKRR